MEFIKEWTITVSSTVLVATLFSVFTPKGSMGKLYKITIAFFIFVSFLLPFTNIANSKLNFEFTFSESQNELEENIFKTNNLKAKKMIEDKILTELKGGGYVGCRVAVEILENSVKSNNSKSDEIKIESVSILVPDDYDKKEIESFVLENTGIKAIIKTNGE